MKSVEPLYVPSSSGVTDFSRDAVEDLASGLYVQFTVTVAVPELSLLKVISPVAEMLFMIPFSSFLIAYTIVVGVTVSPLTLHA